MSQDDIDRRSRRRTGATSLRSAALTGPVTRLIQEPTLTTSGAAPALTQLAERRKQLAHTAMHDGTDDAPAD